MVSPLREVPHAKDAKNAKKRDGLILDSFSPWIWLDLVEFRAVPVVTGQAMSGVFFQGWWADTDHPPLVAPKPRAIKLACGVSSFRTLLT